ncbi:hypothetical protein [Microvirga terricola]|uniref:Uncharacterized protein n=1 Tax=Microvirga terricola TaxID=2719797 RepID=A0ABX0VBZ7_9HYPH|nr:hypothetical protein [Microvirga terricola]NIX77372.1 hypothetical protein [Microvirga terricola]
MSFSSSMALWGAIHDQSGPPPSIETHFNYWRISGDPEFTRQRKSVAVRDFLEVGAMVTHPASLEKLCIYLPFRAEPSSIEDCGPYFKETSVAQGIFNEPLSCNSLGPPGPASIELQQNGTPFCRVHRFMPAASGIDQSELEIQPIDEGTLITVSHPAIEAVCRNLRPDTRAYFRLRIYMREGKDNPFVSVIYPTDHLFQSGFEEVEYLDFRLNEARTLPTKIEAQIRKDEAKGQIPISLIAFLTAVPIVSELAVSNIESHKKRLLEHPIWNDYVPSGIPKGMMVYHWKKLPAQGVANIPDFSSFVKLRTRRSGLKILLAYLFVAFLFGVFGNLVASGLQYAGGLVFLGSDVSRTGTDQHAPSPTAPDQVR